MGAVVGVLRMLQEKKTDRRTQAEAVVDRFLVWFYSSDADAGWHAPNLIARMMEFGGDLPSSSGFHAVDRMEFEVEYLRYFGKDFLSEVRMVRNLKPIYLVAVASDRAYRNRIKVAVDPFTPDKPVEIKWDDGKIAAVLGITAQAYRKRVQRGYAMLEAMLDGT